MLTMRYGTRRPTRLRTRRRDAAGVGVLRLERSHGRGQDGPQRGRQHVQERSDRAAERAEPVAGVDQERQRGDPDRPQGPLPRDAHVVKEVNPAEPGAPESEQKRGEVHLLQLHPSLRPTLLLRLVGGVGRRKLGGRDDFLDELRAVAGEQVPKAQLAIFHEARGAPAADSLDRRGSPDPCRAGEVHEPPHGGAPGHLQRVVVVDPQRLGAASRTTRRGSDGPTAPARAQARRRARRLPGRSAEWCEGGSPSAAGSPSRRSRGTPRPFPGAPPRGRRPCSPDDRRGAARSNSPPSTPAPSRRRRRRALECPRRWSRRAPARSSGQPAKSSRLRPR